VSNGNVAARLHLLDSSSKYAIRVPEKNRLQHHSAAIQRKALPLQQRALHANAAHPPEERQLAQVSKKNSPKKN
jgi:hypothetical protein